jgi:hypothetical protein
VEFKAKDRPAATKTNIARGEPVLTQVSNYKAGARRWNVKTKRQIQVRQTRPVL